MTQASQTQAIQMNKYIFVLWPTMNHLEAVSLATIVIMMNCMMHFNNYFMNLVN